MLLKSDQYFRNKQKKNHNKNNYEKLNNDNLRIYYSITYFNIKHLKFEDKESNKQTKFSIVENIQVYLMSIETLKKHNNEKFILSYFDNFILFD